MAGGAVGPVGVAFDTSGRIYPGAHSGAGGRLIQAEVKVESSLGANATAYFVFGPFPSLPSGTLKLLLTAIANATSGVAKVNPKWASVAASENYDTITLNAEGTTTVTWAAGDNDKLIETKINLDADTLVAGEYLYLTLVFETASWTVAQVSSWLVQLIWE